MKLRNLLLGLGLSLWPALASAQLFPSSGILLTPAPGQTLTLPLSAASGGTGIANNAASTLTISGNFATTLTVSGITGVTLPTSGTLATLAGTESLTNKTLSSFGGAFTFNPANLNFTLSPTGTGTGAIAPATAGSINNMTLGASTPLSVVSTTLTANTSFVLNGSTAKTSTSGTGLILATTTGAQTSGRCVTINGAGDHVADTAACSSGAATAPSVQTGDFTAVAGGQYCVNTTGGAITATMPAAPANGDTILFLDCLQTFATNNLTLGRNALTIMNSATNMTVSTANANFHTTYVSTGGVTTWIIW